jgi:ketosteroid isomerase-like protein
MSSTLGADMANDPKLEAEIAARVQDYLQVLTSVRDPDAARDYYTEDATLVGPGFEFDRPTVVRELGLAFEAGAQIRVNRETLELFAHGDAAYEIACAEDTLSFPDGSSQVHRNRLFIRWERGADGRWRFSRVFLSPLELVSAP